VADVPTIETTCKATFGAGMGPFELMNVTGVPIALHAATTLGRELGPFYAPTSRLREQVACADPWPLDGTGGESSAVAERMQAVVFYVAAALVDEGVGTLEDTDIGARVGLRWPHGPFEMMNRAGVREAAERAGALARRWDLRVPDLLASRASSGKSFPFRVVKVEQREGIATLTVNRPDAMNALDETVVAQLHEAVRDAVADPGVHGIVIAGAGKAFVAGADVRFFVRNMRADRIDRIVEFTQAGHALLHDIENSPKPVVARVDGLTLGGGLELALACHRIVASPKAAMCFPETGIGIYPGLGGTQRTPRRIGADLARWLIYTGEMLPASHARDVGLVDEVCPHAELAAATRRAIDAPRPPSAMTWPVAFAELATFFAANRVEDIRLGKADPHGNERLVQAMKRVAQKAPLALRIAEELIDASVEKNLEDGLRMELEHLVEIFSTEDALEGLTSLGKRKPVFKGR
jgi:enoyl-CoA hydratase/3-hydroxyacyl-CoA dehydrogenase